MTEWKIGDLLALTGSGVIHGCVVFEAVYKPDHSSVAYERFNNHKEIRHATKEDCDRLIRIEFEDLERVENRINELKRLRIKHFGV